jgi:GT2 family glycosyltransferase
MITVIYCTRKSNREHYDHIRKTSGLANKIEVIEIINEGESLTKAYNRGLKQATNDIVVFCHDDIVFTKNGWARKVIKHFDNSDYGILGIAGTTHLNETGRWWTDATKMLGIVKHSWKGKTWESKYSGNFGSEILEAVTVDGLFFAVHKDRIKEDFDEVVEGFHFYEVDFNLRNSLAGVKIGVMFDVKVTHKSIGETNEQWEENRLMFVEKYKNDLPRNIEVNPEYVFETCEMNKEPKLKIFITSTGNVDKVNSLIKQISDCGYENYEVNIIVSEDKVDDFEEIGKLDKVSISEGSYPTIHKNMSVLRWDEDFINEKDELVMFLNDDVTFKTNVISKFVSVYNKDNNFGGIFPRVINSDNTILASGIQITILSNEKNETQIKYTLKGMNSYHGYQDAMVQEPIGSIGFCFMTTYKNLVKHGWFKLEFDNLLFESDFATKCSLDNKNVYVDNKSVVQLSEVFLKNKENLDEMNKDFNTLISSFKENSKSIKFMKKVMVPTQEMEKQE